MKIIYNNDEININFKNSAVCFGNFDGIHEGHHQLLIDLIKNSEKYNYLSVVMVFDPHTYSYFSNNHEHQITTLDEKINKLKKYKIDILHVIKFNKDFAKITAISFIEKILIKKYNTKKIFVGPRCKFGAMGLGNIDLLKKYSVFSTEVITEYIKNDHIISSSQIRKFLIDGDIESAKMLLGCNYAVTGAVIHGKKIGRTIGYPTVNLKMTNRLKPKLGVYAGIIHYNNKKLHGAISIGNRPTITDDDHEILLEMNIFDFNQEIYGANVTIEFIKFIREELKFNNIDDLKIQIEQDIIKIKETNLT